MAVSETSSAASSGATARRSTLRRSARRRRRAHHARLGSALAAVVLVVGAGRLRRSSSVGVARRPGDAADAVADDATRCSSAPRTCTSRWPTPTPPPRPPSSRRTRAARAAARVPRRPRHSPARSWRRSRPGRAVGRVARARSRRSPASCRATPARRVGPDQQPAGLPGRRRLPAPGVRPRCATRCSPRPRASTTRPPAALDALRRRDVDPPPASALLVVGAHRPRRCSSPPRCSWPAGRGGSLNARAAGRDRDRRRARRPGRRWPLEAQERALVPLAARGLGPADRALDGAHPRAALAERREPLSHRAGHRSCAPRRLRPASPPQRRRLGWPARRCDATRRAHEPRRQPSSASAGCADDYLGRARPRARSSTTPTPTLPAGGRLAVDRPGRRGGRASTRHWTRDRRGPRPSGRRRRRRGQRPRSGG